MPPPDYTSTGQTQGSVRLGAWLREHREEVLESWHRAARLAPKAKTVDPARLMDHLPQLLDQIIRAASDAEEGDAVHLPEREPMIHALTRLDEGYDLTEVVDEYARLRTVLFQQLGDRHPSIPRGDFMVVDRAIDRAISRSVTSYANARDRTLRALDRIFAAALSGRHLDAFLPQVIQVLLETAVAVDSVSIMLAEGDHLRVRAAVGGAMEGTEGTIVRLGECFAGRVALAKQPLVVRDAENDERITSASIRKHGTHALFGVPLMADEVLLGVAVMGSRSAHVFSAEDQLLFRTVAARITALISRSQLEENLRTSEERLRLALTSAMQGTWSLDVETGMLRWDAQSKELLGFAADAEVSQDAFWLQVHADDRPAVKEALDRAVNPSDPRDCDVAFRVVGPAGAPERWLRVTGRAWFEDGRAIRVLGTMRDITSFKRQEQRLAEQARLLDLTFDAIIVRDVADRITYWNRGAAELYGVSRDEALGRVVHELLRTEFSEPLAVIKEKLGRDGRWTGELVHTARDGRRITVSSRWVLDRAEGARGAVLETNNDITERKQAERALAAREEDYRLLAEGTPQFVWTALPDGTLTYVNENLARYVGIDPKQVRQLAWRDVVHPDDVEANLPVWQRGEATGKPISLEHRLRSAEGKYRWFVCRAVAMRDRAGVTKWFGTDSDIHDAKLAHEELKLALGFRDQVMGILGHDLRNPLAAIKAGASLLRRPEAAPADVARVASRIERSVDRAATMIAELLDFTHSRFKGVLPVAPGPCDLAEVCRHVVSELKAGNPDHTIELSVEGDCRGTWDRARLGQLASNLVGNALTHGAPAFPVRVSVRDEGEAVVLEVVNQGQPIPPESLPVIFEPFRRGENRSGEQQGLGLGLYIVQQIALAHGGTVAVRSTAEAGTTFAVRLPRHGPSTMH